MYLRQFDEILHYIHMNLVINSMKILNNIVAYKLITISMV